MISETKRLILSKITIDDAPFILELMNSPGWLKYIGDRNVKTIAEAKDHIKNNQLKCYEDFGFGYYKILLKSENSKSIGTSGLLKRATLEDIDIGFSLLPEYHGKGYGFEASSAILELAKKEFKITTVCAITLPHNKASIGLLEKLGMEKQAIVSPFENDEKLLLYKKNL
ncbi:MAG: N-acetyltransferase [Winogradskyella sp.]|nr:MAG: N-acetyltransferase [Winogradskyella sp.]